jgi:hypothetical protein
MEARLDALEGGLSGEALNRWVRDNDLVDRALYFEPSANLLKVDRAAATGVPIIPAKLQIDISQADAAKMVDVSRTRRSCRALLHRGTASARSGRLAWGLQGRAAPA